MESIYTLAELFLFVLFTASLWRIFRDADEHGWAALIPIYNIMVLIRAAEKPAWFLLLLIVPVVNVVIYFIICSGLAERHGYSLGMTLGLFFLPIVFLPILAFVDL